MDPVVEDDAASSIGDRLVINQGAGGLAFELPLTRAEANASGWVKGSCMGGMGTHWWKDVNGDGSMTFQSNNLLPVALMYDEESPGAKGEINAFFIASVVRQQTLLPPWNNQWEPVFLPASAFCTNFCDGTCSKKIDVSGYSTLHVYLKDHNKVTCHGGWCATGCC